MTETMNSYESVVVINPNLPEENINGIITKIKQLIETSAQFNSIDEWGKKKLAYTIKDCKEGYYVMINFDAAPMFPKELERVYKLTDGIIRYVILRKNKRR